MDSIFTVNALLFFGALMVLAGILSSLVATRFGAPILLVFLVVGMLAGEDGLLGIHFSDYRTTYLVGSLALAVILFDGGLRTKAQRFRGALRPSLLLATLGVVITALLVGVVAHFALGFEALEALLLGSMVASTDAAAVFFLLRTGGLHLKERVGAVLEIESGTNDPFAVFLTLVLTQLVLAFGEQALAAVTGELLRQSAFGAILGLGGGLSLAWLLNRLQLPGGLHPLLAVAAAIGIYGLTAVLGGSGFLAVYLAGLVIGNRPVRAYPSIVSFHDAATWLCQIVMFLLLGLLVTPTKLLPYLLPALGIALFLMIVARPVAVWLCLWPYAFSNREKTFIAWVGLRGAVSIFLAAIPTLAGVPHADAYFNVAFVVVLVSLLVQGWTLNVAARRLGLALRRTLPDVARIEVDLPGQFEHEMVGYPIEAGSFVLERNILPSWARPILVVRTGDILSPAEAGALKEDDYAYFLAPADRVHRLDRLFAGAGDEDAAGERPVFGELALRGEVLIGQIAELYELDAAAEDHGKTVSSLFAQHFGERPRAGDRLLLGSRAMLVARGVEDGAVTRAGLQLDELVEQIKAHARLRAPGLTRAIRPARHAWRGFWRRLGVRDPQ
jgi:cell volume regulation protein A